jgi:hypothetical protein
VSFRTAGLADQELTLDKLEIKFGKPDALYHQPVQNSFGAKYDQITATWAFGEVVVTFISISGRTDEGLVDISTAEGRRHREEELRGQVKAQPKL